MPGAVAVELRVVSEPGDGTILRSNRSLELGECRRETSICPLVRLALDAVERAPHVLELERRTSL
jgi:hypothetical protein